MRKLLKQRWIAIVLFLIGTVHLLIIHQTYKPSAYIQHDETHSFHALESSGDGFIDPTLPPPTRAIVLGERESGVEHVADVLHGAFKLDVSIHKHISRQTLLNEDELETITSQTDILWVVVVKSPCEWAESMFRLKRDGCEKTNILQNRVLVQSCEEIGDSYLSKWDDWHEADRGEDIIPVDKRNTGSITYQNIFDMRRQNLEVIQQIVELIPRHVKIVRYGEFQLNPNALVKDLQKEYGFDTKRNHSPIQVNADVTPSLCLSPTKWREAKDLIDWKIEGYFGHHSLDCHLCHGKNDTTEIKVEAPSIIYLLGERNSGTTFVSDTLAEAFDPPNSMGSKLERFSSGIPVLLHKHMFRHDLLNETELAEIKSRTDILWVLVVRSPCDWAEGMYRKPYHLCPPKNPERCGPDSDPNDKIWLNQNYMIGVKLLDFFTTFPWVDWAESVPFLRSSTHREGDEEVSISKPSVDYSYDNVFSLRRHKLEIMKQIIDVAPRNVKLVRLKEIERSPEKFIQDIATEFKLTINEGYKPQVASVVTHSTTCLTPQEWKAAEAGIDWELDGQFGFSPFDCRMCHGYTKSKRLYDRVMQSNQVKKMLKESTQKEDRVPNRPAKALKGKTQKE